MRISTPSITLLKASHESFKGRDGNLVEYDKAVLLDDDGNKFELTVDKDCGLDMSLEKVDGEATFDAFIVRKENTSAIKLRLLSFTPIA